MSPSSKSVRALAAAAPTAFKTFYYSTLRNASTPGSEFAAALPRSRRKRRCARQRAA